MLGHYVVKLHIHCTMRDGDARSSGSKTSAHSVHRLLNVFVVKFDPCPLVLLKRSFFLANLPSTVNLTVLFQLWLRRNIGNLLP